MKRIFTLQNGTVIPLNVNEGGQVEAAELVRLGIATDENDACELLGCAPYEIRYGHVTPKCDSVDEWEPDKNQIPHEPGWLDEIMR